MDKPELSTADSERTLLELRIGTLNVHSWADENLRASVAGVIDVMRSKHLHVLCMQEVNLSEDEHASLLRGLRSKIPFISEDGDIQNTPNDQAPAKSELELIAEAVNGTSIFAPANPYLGNAISTTLKICSWGKKVLRVAYREPRSMAYAEVEAVEGLRIRVFSIHLDHMDESIRMEQMQMALELINDRDRKEALPVILCGDFNALQRSDYTDYEWQVIVGTRARNHWEAPHSELMNSLIKTHGFVDLRGKAATVSGALSTCRFNTRIDYILGRNLPADWRIASFAHDSDSLVSDHKPVSVTIEIPGI